MGANVRSQESGVGKSHIENRLIGSSVHPLIDSSAEHGVGFRWPDDPMVRWSDHSVLHDVLETKRVSDES